MISAKNILDRLFSNVASIQDYSFKSGLPTEYHDIRRNRKTIVYTKSDAKKVLLICKIDLFFIIFSLIISIN